MDREYSPAEAKAWLAGYDAGKAFAEKKWVGLAGYEVNECAAGCHNGNSVQDAIRKAEAKLKGKNND